MRGRQLLRLLEYGARLRHVSQRKIFLDRTRIDVALQPPVRQQRLELGAENEHAVAQDRVIQWLDAQSVAGEKQRRAVPVPKRERKHSAKALDACLAPGFPRMDDDLGVAARSESVA